MHERLNALGLEFTPSAPVADTPDGGTPGAFNSDPLRLSSPVGGINYCYDAGDQPGENCQNGDYVCGVCTCRKNPRSQQGAR